MFNYKVVLQAPNHKPLILKLKERTTSTAIDKAFRLAASSVDYHLRSVTRKPR